MHGALTLNVLLIDDHPLILVCNHTLVSGLCPDAEIRSLTHVQDLHQVTDLDRVDLIISDLIMPDISTWQVVDTLETRCPNALLVFLSSEDEKSDLAVKIVSSGHLYIQKSTRTTIIAEQISAYWDSRRSSDRGGPLKAGIVPDQPGLGKLSQEQVEIFECMLEGLTVQEISNHLGVSVHTIISRSRRAYKLLGASNQAMAINSYLKLKRFRQFVDL